MTVAYNKGRSRNIAFYVNITAILWAHAHYDIITNRSKYSFANKVERSNIGIFYISFKLIIIETLMNCPIIIYHRADR